MRKLFRLIVPFLFFGILITLFLGIKAKLKTRKQVEEAIARLPEVNYLTPDSTAQKLFNPKRLTTIVVFFNSDCDFCQIEARNLNETREDFKGAKVYLFSTEPLENIRTFKESFLPDNTDFTLGQIDPLTSSEIFGVNTFPYTLIYDKANHHVKTFKGVVKPEALIQYIDD